jgi:hypothetical protein
MGRISFDDALSQASGFTDKSLRALTTLVLVDLCLQRAGNKEKADWSKKKARLEDTNEFYRYRLDSYPVKCAAAINSCCV